LSKKTCVIALVFSVIIFIAGLTSILKSSFPDAVCMKRPDTYSCNDSFNGECTKAGACSANAFANAVNCSIECFNYIFDINGICRLERTGDIPCGVMKK